MKKIKKSDYICDKRFHLDEVLEMFQESSLWGCVLVSGDKTMIYTIEKSGKHVNHKLLKKIDVRLIKKQKKGGQSAQRFGRIREENELHQISCIVEEIRRLYSGKDIKGILLAGPAEMKKKVRRSSEFSKHFDKLCIGIVNTDEINETTINRVYKENFELFNEQEAQNWIKKIKEMFVLNDNRLVFGEEIQNCLESCLLETLITDDKTRFKIDYECRVVEIGIRELGFNDVGIRWY